jgi:hypothetical protein
MTETPKFKEKTLIKPLITKWGKANHNKKSLSQSVTFCAGRNPDA